MYCHVFFLLLLQVIGATSRPLQQSFTEVISDGTDHIQESSSLIRLYGEDSAEFCEQMYGFLPCSNTLPGHLFLILVYEYLLFHGESYVAAGGERIFKILGPGVFGASAFQILGFLPETLILLASGLLNSEEVAQEYVLTGVGLLAGTTILLLTIIWGTCVLVGNQELRNDTQSQPPLSNSEDQKTHLEAFLSRSKGPGVVTDLETCKTARIMVSSVIPLAIMLILRFPSYFSSWEQLTILICLVVSVVFLLLYFFYQICQPWIQKRRLEYVKHEHLVVDILKHLQNQAIGKLLTEDGTLNVPAIKKLFDEIDQDNDSFISVLELKELLNKIRSRKLREDKDQITEEIWGDLDHDSDGKITLEEFMEGFEKWIGETKQTMNRRYHSTRSLKDLYEILKPWIQKKKEEHEMTKHIISVILKHVQDSAIGSLLTEDGKPDTNAIKRLFESIDKDGNRVITRSELKELINKIKFGIVPSNAEETVDKIMEELDASGDKLINEDEFVNGLCKWLHITNKHVPSTVESKDDVYYQKNLKTIDRLLENRLDGSTLAWTKAIMLLALGIAMLGLLAEPLIQSVQNLSAAANVPSFFISFILVPLATNARIGISAIKEARHKKQRTTSLTFSEIYGGVFMNNVLGFCVLLSLIYFRGLSWHFSAEILVLLMVCGIMGCLTSLSTFFPVWTSAIAYLLYPLSLVLVYVFDDSFNSFST
nr:sodium/calcium exchanger NCL2-like [Ipomoea batatas]